MQERSLISRVQQVNDENLSISSGPAQHNSCQLSWTSDDDGNRVAPGGAKKPIRVARRRDTSVHNIPGEKPRTI